MKHDYTKFLHPIRYCGLACDGCGKSMKVTELVIECQDCAALFCEECAEDGIYSTHQCEDYVKNEEWDTIRWREDDVALFEEGYWCD